MVFTVKHASVSDHITLCAVIFTVRRISASVHITLHAVVFTMRRISASAHITLRAVVFTVTRISASVHLTLRAVVVDYGDSQNLTLSSISRGRLASPDGTFDVADARNSEVLASNPGGSDVCH